jgi:hypothetical protein
MPPRTAKELADHGHRSAEDAKPRPQGFQAGRGGTPLEIGGRRDDGGLENADQRQLDRETAAIGREDRPGLPDKPDAGGAAKLEKGTSLSDNASTSGSASSHQP